jgi:MarR family transcriptional regulator, organic hydroperoxide resistance regulator
MNAKRERYSSRLDEGLDFLRLLWSVDHALRRMSKRMTSSLGITGPQRLVIRIVGQFPGINAGDVAEILKVHPSTLTGVFKRLHQRGLIVRQPDSQDKRRIVLRLSAKGREYDASMAETIESVVRRVVSDVPPRELKATRHVLERLTEALQAKCRRR